MSDTITFPDRIEAAVRRATGKASGDLTAADIEGVTTLYLDGNQLTNVDALATLTKAHIYWR